MGFIITFFFPCYNFSHLFQLQQTKLLILYVRTDTSDAVPMATEFAYHPMTDGLQQLAGSIVSFAVSVKILEKPVLEKRTQVTSKASYNPTKFHIGTIF